VRVALDATYSVDPRPTGIGVYSRELLNGLAIGYPEEQFVHCYRPKQFRRAPRRSKANVKTALLLPPLPTFRAQVFHALNQRVDKRPASRVVSTFHDLFVISGEYSSAMFRARFAEQARKAAERSDLIIAVSEFTADQLTSLLHVERQRVRVIPHGVVPPSVTPPDKREQLVLFVGALQARKNVIRLVEAFEKLPAPWRLVLAGAPDGYKAEGILARIAASPSRSRIDVTGYLSRGQLEDFFSRASIFAFPSLDEGFGIPVLEAMAWSVPVITSDGSALAELGRDAALLVDPNIANEIADALQLLARDETLRNKLISAGRMRAAKFTWGRAVEETYAVYRELAG
jgi:glycosyltransferase involved in cell wall biosynthesis